MQFARAMVVNAASGLWHRKDGKLLGGSHERQRNSIRTQQAYYDTANHVFQRNVQRSRPHLGLQDNMQFVCKTGRPVDAVDVVLVFENVIHSLGHLATRLLMGTLFPTVQAIFLPEVEDLKPVVTR